MEPHRGSHACCSKPRGTTGVTACGCFWSPLVHGGGKHWRSAGMTSTSSTSNCVCAGISSASDVNSSSAPRTRSAHCARSLCLTGVSATLHARRKGQQEDVGSGLEVGPAADQPQGLNFTTATGRVTDPRSLNRMLTDPVPGRRGTTGARARSAAHLRFTAAGPGVDARTIMETLGHSTITMTLDTYAHVMEHDARGRRRQDGRRVGTDERRGG